MAYGRGNECRASGIGWHCILRAGCAGARVANINTSCTTTAYQSIPLVKPFGSNLKVLPFPFPVLPKTELMRLMNFPSADFPDDFLFGAATAAYLIQGQAFGIMMCLGLGILLFSHALDR